MRNRTGDGDETEGGNHVTPIDLPDAAAYAVAIREAHAHLTDADAPVVIRLANFRRLIDWHSARLGGDPGNAFSTDQLQKLSTLALRHEDALGISRKKTPEPESPSNRPGSIRRREEE